MRNDEGTARDGRAGPGGYDARRAVQIIARSTAGPGPSGQHGGLRGSGYQIAADRIMTAAHVVADSDVVTVRFVNPDGSARMVDGEVVFVSRQADLAVVRIPLGDTAGAVHAPARFGRIDRPAPCEALGFPRFKMRRLTTAGPAVQYRDTRHVIGTAIPDSNLRDGGLELRVDAPERDPDPARSPWEGMSGAAVWSRGRIIGVVSEHRRADGLDTLTATRADRWAHRLTAEQAERLRELIGFPDERARPVTLGRYASVVEDYLAAAELHVAAQPYFGSATQDAPPLADVYLRQLATRLDIDAGEAGDGDPEDQRSVAGVPLPAMELLSGAGAAVCAVVGGPGGGKSSLLRTLAASSLARWRDDVTDTPVPVIIRAADLTAGGTLLEAAAAAVTADLRWHGLAGGLPPELFRTAPGPQAPWLLLIDGVDEITDTGRRRQLLSALGALARGPQSAALRIILATRPLPQGELDLLGREFPWYGLQPFTARDVRLVAASWFEALRLSDVQQAVERFSAALARRERLTELARTPLMTAMLCRLFAESPVAERDLPDSRGEIYRQFTDLLFQRVHEEGRSAIVFQAEDGLRRFGQDAVGRAREVLSALPDLIGELAERRRAGTPGSAVDVIAALPAGTGPGDVPQEQWRGFLDSVLRRSGLMAPRGADLDFLHLTLQDFLAARHAVRDGQERARLLHEALRLRRTVAAARYWRPPPAEQLSYFGFVLDPGDRDAADAGPAIERLLGSRHARLAVCRLLADLSQLGVALPQPAKQQALALLRESAAGGGKEDRTGSARLQAAQILAVMDREAGWTALETIATQDAYSGHRFDAVRELASYDRQRTADLLASMAGNATHGMDDRLRAARLLHHLDAARGLAWFGSNFHQEPRARLVAADFARLRYRQDVVRSLAGVDRRAATGLLEEALRAAGPLFGPLEQQLALTLGELDREGAQRLLGELHDGAAPDGLARTYLDRALDDVLGAGPAAGASSAADHVDDTWVRLQLARLMGVMCREDWPDLTAAAPSGNPSRQGSGLPDGLLSSIEDPAAANLLHEVARGAEGGRTHHDLWRVTAAWQLARLGDPRAARLLDGFASDAAMKSSARMHAARAMALADRRRALALMEQLASDRAMARLDRRRLSREGDRMRSGPGGPAERM